MARKRSLVLDYAVYLAVRFLVLFLQILPWPATCRLSDWLAWLAYHLDKRHRRVADDNLKHAFPDLEAVSRDRLVRATYRHFCRLALTLVMLPRRMNVAHWKRHLDMPGAPMMVEALLTGRPVLLVTGHFGNWELGGYALGLLGFRTWAIARRLDNPFFDRFLKRFRQKTGQTILDKSGDFARIEQVLHEGGVLATLGDQDAGERGMFVDFFGRPASTHRAVALLALEHQAIMVVLGIPHVGEPMRYRMEVEDVIHPEEYADHRDPVRAITERFTAGLERMVRRHPEQYFWLHRRWKHQPKARKARKAA